MRYNKILDLLHSRGVHTVDLGLERIEKLLKKLGNPHKKLDVILVAGTNGKGSTAAMISSILQEANFKVGVYSSPHLVRFTERFKINKEEILKKEIEALFEKIKPHLNDNDGLTYFEIITAMAYLYFKEQGVDYAVMEVGMGGRLDATNVVDPIVSVITNVSLEHTQYLGKCVEEIAYEKAGIIREHGYVVTAAEGEVLEVLRQIAMQKQATLLVATPTGLDLGLRGEFQKINAGLAIKTIKTLKYSGVEIPKIALMNGLSKATLNGRFQFFKRNVIIDCAHNVASVEVIMDELTTLKEEYVINPSEHEEDEKKYGKFHLVFGAMKDKDVKQMISLLEPFFDTITITRPHGDRGEMKERSEDPKVISKYISRHEKVNVVEEPKQALKKAQSLANDEDLILVTGSCYLIGDIIRG
ncbi:bifunctional folylpolyglutamate synthase/dihydrofolate synthase [Candidatus Woesearchaeota archaeon]|nr:bifunctional folylpolyglutamate synthase/dihydrofolate synthase [Candidatus Woesearchaeota archaeon]